MNPAPPLWDHQTLTINRADEIRDLALFHDPGTGKTRTTIEILKRKYNGAKRIKRTLVLGPIIVAEQWRRQVALYSKIPKEKVIVLLGDGKKRVKAFLKACGEHPQGFIAIMNYEGILIEKLWEEISEWEPEILVADESHRLKDPTTSRFKLLRPVADKADHRFILTGSPILNSPMDIWAQYRLMNKGESFMGFNPRTHRPEPMSFMQFRNHYFYDRNAGMPKQSYFPDWVAKPMTASQLATIMSTTATQARKEEVLDLPPLLHVPLYTTLGTRQRTAYEEMARDYITAVKENVITANLAITQALRLRQILAGFVPTGEDGKGAIFFDDVPRLDMLKEKVRDLVEQKKKVIIWTCFVPTYEKISKELAKLNIPSVMLTGLQNAKEKDANVLAFRHGDMPVAICNPQAVSLGVELTEAQYSIRYDRSYSLEHQLQGEARNYRGGSEMHEHITQYDLCVPGTLDEAIMLALQGKQNVAQALLNWAHRT